MIDEESIKYLKDLYSNLEKTVFLKLFISKEQEYSSNLCISIVKTLETLSNKIKVEIFVKERNEDVFEEYSVEYTPCFVIENEELKKKWYYYGVPWGSEFSCIAEAIPFFGIEIREKEKINENYEIICLVNPACGFCPETVIKLTKILVTLRNIKLKIYQVLSIPEIMDKYKPEGYPLTIIYKNNKVLLEILGKIDENLENKIKEILKKGMA